MPNQTRNALQAMGRFFSRRELPAPTGASGTRLSDAYAVDNMVEGLMGMPDPDEILRQLNTGRQFLRSMEYDDEISGALETRREATVCTGWRLEHDAPDSDPVMHIWNELDACLDTFLRGAWDAVPYGYSVLELNYGPTQAGRIGVTGMNALPFEWFAPTRDGRLIYNQGPGGAEVLQGPVELKFFLTRRNPTYRNPYGEALLSRLYWAWYFRHNGWRFWMQFVERFGEPLLMGKTLNPQQFVTFMSGLGYEAVVAVDKDEDISAVNPASPGEFERLENALTKRVQKLVLGQTMTTDTKGGSYAAAKVGDDVRDDKRQSDIRLCRPTVQRLVDVLWHLNRFPGKAPVFELSDGTGIEPERAERDAKLFGTGVVKPTEQYLLRAYDFEEGDFTINESAQSIPQGLSVSRFAPQEERFTPVQSELERMIGRASGGAPEPIDEELIRAAIRGARDVEDLQERLSALLGRENPAFNDLLARSAFAAEVMGYVAETEQRT